MDGKKRIINLVGGTCYDECIENTVLSSELGLPAIAILPPSDFKHAVTGVLAEFVAQVGQPVPRNDGL